MQSHMGLGTGQGIPEPSVGVVKCVTGVTVSSVPEIASCPLEMSVSGWFPTGSDRVPLTPQLQHIWWCHADILTNLLCMKWSGFVAFPEQRPVWSHSAMELLELGWRHDS